MDVRVEMKPFDTGLILSPNHDTPGVEIINEVLDAQRYSEMVLLQNKLIQERMQTYSELYAQGSGGLFTTSASNLSPLRKPGQA